MFLPGSELVREQDDKERKSAYSRIEAWCLEIIPPSSQNGLMVAVREIACGDPQCSPIDTSVTLLYDNGCSGMFGIPMEAREVTKEDLLLCFPTEDILAKWHNGVDAEWPPLEEEEEEEEDPYEMPALRFSIGTKVLCRIGPDAEKDWAPGLITQLWYREANWPPDSFAPYKVLLDDGRKIFAPGDMDQIIQKLR